MNLRAENTTYPRFRNQATASQSIASDMRAAAELQLSGAMIGVLTEIEERWLQLDESESYTVDQKVAIKEQRIAVRQAFADRGVRLDGGAGGGA